MYATAAPALVGGTAFSTAGGIKVGRFVILYQEFAKRIGTKRSETQQSSRPAYEAYSSISFTANRHRSSDNGILDRILEEYRTRDLRAIYVDVSYPSEMEELARRARHYTPTALLRDLRKLEREVPILAVHLKPSLRDRVAREIARLRHPWLRVAEIGRDVRW